MNDDYSDQGKLIEFDKFESISDFKQSITWGKEIEFEWNGVIHVAFRFEGKGDKEYLLGEANTDSKDVYFSSADSMLDFEIDGQKLRDIITEVDVIHRNL